MINFNVRCPGDKGTAVFNGADIKKKTEGYEKIDKITSLSFKDVYTTQYNKLVEKIDDLYERYSSGENSDEDGEYPTSEFVSKVREIVGENEKIYEETCKQIDNYTCKIPPMPWAYGCTIRSTVMYILHNPIIKCAVQYFEHYKEITDESGCSFDQMVKVPENYMHEWHNCMVMFIRLLKLTYEELESNHTDTKVHGKLWNQIQGLEYLMHFLCFAYRRGYFSPCNVIEFLKIFLKILGVFDFGSLEWGKKELLDWSLYCSDDHHSFSKITGHETQQVNENCDSLCCEEGKQVYLRAKNEYGEEEQIKMFCDIAFKGKRTNYMIFHSTGNHFFPFYKKPNVEGADDVYYTHDGWYEYQYHGDEIGGICKFCYYEIPFTYIILPKLRDDLKKVQLKEYFGKCEGGKDFICFWDFFIPLLSTDLRFVKGYCDNLGENFYAYCEKVEDHSKDDKYSYVFDAFFCDLKRLYKSLKHLYDEWISADNGGKNFKIYLKGEKVGGVCAEKTDIVRLKKELFEGENKIEKEFKEKKTWEKKMKDFSRKMINLTKSFLTDDVIGFIEEGERNEYLSQILSKKIPKCIKWMFKTYVLKGHFFINRDFIKEKLVIEGNGANSVYSDQGHYDKNDVLKVDWTKTGLKQGDFAIFRKKFAEYKIFGSEAFKN